MDLVMDEVRLLLQLLVAGLQARLVGAGIDLLAQQRVAHHVRARLIEHRLDRRIVGERQPLGLLGQQLRIDHPVEQHRVDRLQRHLAHLFRQALRRRLEFAAQDLIAIDHGHDGIRRAGWVGGPRRRAEREETDGGGHGSGQHGGSSEQSVGQWGIKP